MTPRSTVVGVFHDREDAREAIEALKDDGFSPDAISILSPDKQATKDIAEDTGTHAGAGAATGALAGGILGGLGGWLLGIGALAIPGIGPFIAAGAFASALGGAAIGAGVGAIAGALMGMGVPEDQAEYYEGEAKAGRTLVTVRAPERYDDAQRILRDHGAYDIETRDTGLGVSGAPSRRTEAASLRTEAPARTAGQGQESMQLREEELVARKEQVETGQVQIGKEVVSEQRTLEVPVTREEVTIERHPVDRRPSERPIGERGETIEVPVREEQVQLEKQAVVYEEVGVGKREVQETQQVSGTVRREEARIEHEGAVNTGSTGAGTGAGWDQAMPGYRQRWQQRYGTSGDRWEDAEPAYRYGHEMRSRPEYRGRQWTDVEPEFQRDWAQRNPGKPWDKASRSIRESWDEATNR
ncbi:MAG: YsnF/AvaK domain-containing protein [Chloroflexota bacterium]